MDKEARKIIDLYGLQPYLWDFILTNGDAAFNPYHNLLHAFRMAIAAHAAAVEEAPLTQWGPNQFATIVVACLFHDWRHPGGVGKNDAENVRIAAEKVLYLPPLPGAGVLSWDAKLAHSGILGTVFPLPDDVQVTDLPYIAQVMRDSDVWNAAFLSDSDYLAMQVGLAKEAGKPLAEHLAGNSTFLQNAPAITGWGRKVADRDGHRDRMAGLNEKWAQQARNWASATLVQQ